MKPIQLTMTAFGPYKDQEVIQFSDLNEHKLFVVSGKTGAGKTTLFDGICFALYGTASGEDRGEPRMMRSHFAADDVHTSVEFIFELQNRRYRILRQMPHVKAGNKSATGEKYEFFEQKDDKEIPCVDRQMVSEINQKVKDLVGLTEDQFKQIVMLPQGEFRKLLTSETDNKEAILRKIFKTEPYQWFAERLKTKRRQAEKDHEVVKYQLNQQISHVREAVPARDDSQLANVFEQEHWLADQVLAALAEEETYYQHELKDSKTKAEQAKNDYEKKLGEYHEAKQINQQFEQLAEKEAELAELEKKKDVMTKKKTELAEAENAAGIAVYEDYRQKARADEQLKEQQQNDAARKVQEAARRREAADQTYRAEQAKQTEREQTAQELSRYEELVPIVQEAEKEQQSLVKMKKDIDQMQQKREKLQQQIESVKQEIAGLREAIQQLEQAVEVLPEKRERLNEMKETGKIFRDYINHGQKEEQLQRQLQEDKAAFEKEKQQFQVLERSWVRGQATVLARRLEDGEACPVCGSREHPAKALHEGEVPTQEEFEQAREKFERVQQRYLQAEADTKAKQREVKALAEQLTSFDFSSYAEAQTIFNRYVEEAKALESEVKGLDQSVEEVKKKRTDKDTKEQELTNWTAELDKLANELQQHELTYASAQSTYDEKISRVPEQLRTLAALQPAVEERRAKKKQLEKAWEEAQTELTNAKQHEASVQAEEQAAQQQVKESRSNRKETEERFAAVLKEAGFSSEEAYRKAVMPEEMRTELKREIEDYSSTVDSLQKQIIALNKTLADHTRADLDALTNELATLQQKRDQAYQRQTQAENYLKQITEAAAAIKETIAELKTKETNVQTIADLHDMVRGQNSSKISFERYVQIEFLEHIIVAANERLQRISNGQFHLVRSARQESRGKQSGLSLDVYDAYTGQNRDVKTLSGGEKFNASLSLALGMSDVIQSHQGGVTIDTMFIDEGFGSLDDESLQKVIDTLIDLQRSGRTIGVISHVQEMKNVFPAILEVNKTPEGFSRTRFVVQ
ncbi:AAA family ATPase [Salisediminibacterium halotolerans]|uniref:Nuclease SbcCD subunit C n=1 Tax=Salisediminibacterium halotolerans TaxID=517425 RepID=A0A1H9SVH7_9BACI|nr:SMC family ATPase [Salisediminibacterium haloalkalitolerans]SER88847.1 exonuclease SbcC [Salisediminibacterium haloalkalitolerans]